METIRTQGGKFYGWTTQDGLFNREGQHVGQIYRGIVYDEAGLYLGELREGRLITDILRKDTHRWYGYFANNELTIGNIEADGQSRPMPNGYEEFPSLPRAVEPVEPENSLMLDPRL